MNDEELKKKIVGMLKEAMKPIEYGGDREHAPEVHYPTEEEIADTLIAAGISDAKEAEHRAARAEKAFFRLVHEMYEQDIRPMCDEKFFIESRLKDAEKEIAEERNDE